MRMLRWICGKARKDRICKEQLREIVKIAPISDKTRENHLRWFGLVQSTLLSAPIRKCDGININKDRRGISELTQASIIKKDMNMICMMILLWTELNKERYERVWTKERYEWLWTMWWPFGPNWIKKKIWMTVDCVITLVWTSLNGGKGFM